MNRRGPLASFGGLLLVLGLAWRPFLFGSRSPFERDIEFYHHPVTRELASAWSEGRIPLWTDRVYCGFPFFADPQTAAWYPGTLLVVALGPHAGYVAFLLLHALLAALFMSALVRAHGGGDSAALAAALVVPLSGFYASEMQHPGLFAILAWIPAWLLATRAVFVRVTPARLGLASLPLAMMIFAGTLQVLFGAVPVYACYVAGLCAEGWERGRPALLRGVGAVLASQLLALLLGAVVLLPGFAHLPLTARALGMTYAFGSMGSVHPLQLLGMFVNGAATLLPPDRALDFDGASFYVGCLTLPLALLALFGARRRLPLAMGSAAFLLALLALGRYGFLYRDLYALAPGIVGSLRGVGRAIGPGVVCVALLAGLGLQRVGEPRAGRLFAGLVAVGLAAHASLAVLAGARLAGSTVGSAGVLAAALGVWLARKRLPWLLKPGLAVLVALDLLCFGAFDDVVDRSPPPPSAAQLAGALRFPALADIAGRLGGRGERVLLLGFGTANFTFHHGLDGVGGYNPLVTLQYLDFAALVNDGELYPRKPLDGFVHDDVPARVDAPLFQAASTRFVISAWPLAGEGLELRARYAPHPLTGRPVLLYENRRALPRAYLAYRSRRAGGVRQLAGLLGEDFDARHTSVFEGDALPLDGPATIDAVEPQRPRPELLRFDVSADRPALLVVTDSWYPGWRARVDGVEAPVLRVNANFRGVPVPAGARRVEMRFEPAVFRPALGLSLAAAIAIAGLTTGRQMLRLGRRIW